MAFRPARYLSLAALAAAVVAAEPHAQIPLAGTVGHQNRVTLHTCDVPGVPGGGRCGTYEVWEDRDAKAGRKIALNIVVIPALSDTPAPDPVFWLHGGPGAAATQVAPAAAAGFLAPLREDHDIVFVDQRGTGASNGLQCDVGDDPSDLDAFFGKLLPLDLVRACAAKLASIADVRLYTTPIAMDDLDEVREAMGYSTIDIVGASYGTIAAQVYLRRHGAHVRAAFLIGVATPGLKQPLPFAPGAQRALAYLFADCAADSLCQATYPHVREEFDTVLARFAAGPLTVQMVDPVTGEHRAVALERENYVEHLRLMLYTTIMGSFVPLVVHRAYEGDFVPFEAVAIRSSLGGLVARGMYLAVTCAEGVPFITDSEVVASARGTFVGETRVRRHLDACKAWPAGHVPPTFIEPVKSDAPVLMISGELDGSTPPSLGEGAVRFLPNGRQIRIRYTGHQIDSPCVWGIMQAFIRKASVAGLDTACVTQIRRPPFATELPKPLQLP